MKPLVVVALVLITSFATPAFGDAMTEHDVRDAIAMSWPEQLVEKAVRVAFCESTWRPTAENRGVDRVYGRYASLGLFQIETVATSAWSQVARAWYGDDSDDVWLDPVRNARIALEVYRQQGWKAWPTCGRR